MKEQKNRWKDLRAIVVVRQSSDTDRTSSTAAQLDYMKNDLKRVGMSFVRCFALEGVSGSAPAKLMPVLEEIFSQKQTKKDFDVIAWQVEDRASRSGGEFGMWLEHEAKRRGLLVYFAGDELVNVAYAPVVRVAKYEAAKEVSISNGRRSAQGQTWAIKSGYFRTAGHTPIGCDRLYFGPDNQLKFVIRNLKTGLQEQLDFETKAVIGRYGTVGERSHNRFKKQRNEYSLLIPGDAEEQRVVRIIFFLRFRWGWRGMRIADYLNRNGVRTAKERTWSQRQVQIVYENEAYTGVTYNNQTWSGRFFRRDKSLGFVPLERDAIEQVSRKSFSPVLRPMDEWERIDQPWMYDFLPRDVRDLAIADHASTAAIRTDVTRKRRKRNAHPASAYLFSGRLIAKQDGKPLVGTLSGPPGKKTAYYRHKKKKSEYRKGSIYNNLIRADVLHDAAVKMLAEVLSDIEDLRRRLTAFTVEQRKGAMKDAPDITSLEGERDELKQRIALIMNSLTGAALDDAKEELSRLGARRNALEERLKQARQAKELDLRPINEVVNDALQVIKEDSAQLGNLCPDALRETMSKFVQGVSVDMETKEVEFTVALPTWAVGKHKEPRKSLKNEESAMCPLRTSRSRADDWTHTVFARLRCEYQRLRGSHVVPPCYRCRRIAA